jgi:CD109 antigen
MKMKSKPVSIFKLFENTCGLIIMVLIGVDLYKTEKVAVKANSVNSVTFLIAPIKLGLVELNVKAESRLAGDALVKMLRVVPPGQPQKLNKAVMIDTRRPPSAPLNITAKFPSKRVPDSDFVKFSVVGDILGPAISNLDRLLGKSL